MQSTIWFCKRFLTFVLNYTPPFRAPDCCRVDWLGLLMAQCEPLGLLPIYRARSVYARGFYNCVFMKHILIYLKIQKG